MSTCLGCQVGSNNSDGQLAAILIGGFAGLMAWPALSVGAGELEDLQEL